MLRTDAAKAVYLKNYAKPDYRIETVDLTFELDPEATRVTAKISIVRPRGVKAGTPLKLDGDGLTLESVSLDGELLSNASRMATPDQLILQRPPKAFTLEVVTTVNPSANTALSGLYRSGGNYCTQCEAEGFRRITYFLDRPDMLAVYTVRLEADRKQAPVLLSNGNPVEKGKLAGGRHYAVWHDPHPKPSYLFALVGGDLASISKRYTTSEGRKVKLAIYVEKGKEERARYAMDALVRSIRWDEKVFNCAYDLDVFNIVAVSDFNMGAMENKGLNIFNDKYVLADGDTATDADFARIEAIIAHEYFHNWTGNRITCRDWFQLCLKEGLTVYRDQEFSADMRSRAVKRIDDVAMLRSHQFPEDQGPLAHPVRPQNYREINNFYTATVYEKGAEVVRMLGTLLGPDVFSKAISRYLSKHDGDAATVEDFIACFEFASKRDLSQFFLWYTQAGTPHLHVSTKHDRKAKTFTVEIEQNLQASPGQSRKKLMHIPVRIGLVGSKSGDDLAPESVTGAEQRADVFELTQRRHKIVFSDIVERPILSINRGFSAPVEVDYEQPNEDLIFLSANDSDPFNRWEAFRTVAMRQIKAAVTAIDQRRKPRWSESLIEAAVSIARNEELEPAFRSILLTLPGESEVARSIGSEINPDLIHSARRSLQTVIGNALEPHRGELLEMLSTDGDYTPAAADAGRRALANLLLAYGIHADGEPAAKAAKSRFDSAGNMTDRESAFRLIVTEMHGSDAAEAALRDFYDRYRDDSIVLDKWFMTQSLVPGRAALGIVNDLVAHDDFTWTNPNRVRSVVHVFASANPTGFNRADGKGFEFVADAVKRLDPINPQVAARLLTTFRSWRMLEAKRAGKARAALSALAETKPLSGDVSEILTRILEN